MKRILIAGIGNIFLGDDAFGVEVAREFPCAGLPPTVWVKDFGIRSYDLAYALTDGFDAAILVDAMPHGEPAGTLSLIEPDVGALGPAEQGSADAHSMEPRRVLQMARTLGKCPDRLYLLGCEPAELGGEEGHIGLSDTVRAAVPKAIELIQLLIEKETDYEIEPAIKEHREDGVDCAGRAPGAGTHGAGGPGVPIPAPRSTLDENVTRGER